MENTMCNSCDDSTPEGRERSPARHPDLQRTATALAIYDSGAATRARAWDRAMTEEAIMACQERDDEAWSVVTDCFAKDTSDRNSKEQAKLVDVVTLRRWVEAWKFRRDAALRNDESR
jgi:hypothetical protein